MDPPPLWGVEDHVRELFGGTGVELEFRHEQAEMRFPSVEDAIEFYSTKFGPVIMAKQALEPEGRWEALRDDMAALYRQSLHDGEVVFQPEYLVILGRRAG